MNLQVKKRLLLLFVGCLPGAPDTHTPAVLNWIAVRPWPHGIMDLVKCYELCACSILLAMSFIFALLRWSMLVGSGIASLTHARVRVRVLYQQIPQMQTCIVST